MYVQRNSEARSGNTVAMDKQYYISVYVRALVGT